MLLLTGSSGFLGSALYRHWHSSSELKTLARKNADINIDIANDFDITEQLQGIKTVVHCAGRAHIMAEKGVSDAYYQCNFEGTMRLAKQCIQVGVKRFIFISTIKVVADKSHRAPLSETDSCHPSDDYSRSKLKAEQVLMTLHSEQFHVVILRLPLLYGRGHKGNLQLLERILKHHLPLPFGGLTDNKRSLLSIENAVSAIDWALTATYAKGQLLHVADARPISTVTLITQMKRELKSQSFIIPIPLLFLRFFFSLLRKSAVLDRLAENLEIDTGKINTYWRAPFSFREAIARTYQY